MSLNPLQVNHNQPFTHENMAYKVIGVRQLPNTHHYSNDGTVTLVRVGDLVITAQYDHQLTELLFPPQPKEPEYPKYYEAIGYEENDSDIAYIRRTSAGKCRAVQKDGSDRYHEWVWSTRDNARKQITKEQADAIVDSFKPKPVESPDDLVVQDRVPIRPNIDQYRWSVWCDGFWVKTTQDTNWCHGQVAKDGTVLSVRCHRKDLPPIPDDITPQPKDKRVKLHAYIDKRELANPNYFSLNMFLTDTPQPDNTTLLEVKGLDLYVDVPVN